jgi:8-oxo-dGTP pyrophosphatase MutT (NUDIX family)
MIQIAGGVVYNPKHGIVVVNQNHNSWSLPKGHVEEGEENLAGAIREIWEESGIPPEKLVFQKKLLSYERDRIQRNPTDTPEMREITLYLFTTDQEHLEPRDPINPEARWVKIPDVSAYLTHPVDKERIAHIVATEPLFSGVDKTQSVLFPATLSPSY